MADHPERPDPRDPATLDPGAADPASTQDAGAAARLRGALGRARRVPGQLHDVADDLGHARGALDELRDVLARVEELGWAGRLDTQGGVAAIGDELHRLHRHVDAVQADLHRLDSALSAQAAGLHRAIVAPGRAAAAEALRASLGPSPTPAPGLSVFVTCWNHGALLAGAVTSALAALDRLPTSEQGQVLILDDASTDRTSEVATGLADADRRVRLIRSDVNLGLTHGRNVLLHAVGSTHVFNLDADNVCLPAGVAELHQVARSTGAASTYGTVVQVADDGAIGPISNEPITPALFESNYIDTMGVIDVATVRAMGGWATDPLTEHVDDWTMVRRLVEAGALLAFVPTLVGRYRVLPGAFHRSTPDKRIGAGRVARVTDPTGRRSGPDAMDGVAAVAAHPTTGVLWATPAAIALDPSLAPAAPPAASAPDERRPRVLVVAPGGVANLGDDAITLGGLARLRGALPGARLDMVTDGGQPPPLDLDVGWLGSLIDALPGLDPAALDQPDPTVDRRHTAVDPDHLGLGTPGDDAGGQQVPGEAWPPPGDRALAAPSDILARAADEARVGEGRWRPVDVASYDLAVFLGGGSLASPWATGLIGPRAVLAAALRHAGIPYACSGQGVGPLDDDADRELVAGLMAGAGAVGCRDADSAELVRGLPGVDGGQITVTGDDALGLHASVGPRPTDRQTHRPTGVLAVTVRQASYVGADGRDDPVARWALAADAVAADRGWEVRGVALNHQRPEPEVATLARLRATLPLRARWTIVECGRDPGALVEAVSTADAVAAQSFHAALLALDAGVPAVLAAGSPYYEAKAAGLAERAGLPSDVVAVSDPEGLGAALDTVAGALVDRPRPLAAATAAVDAWWSALPDVLATAGPTSARPAAPT